VYSSQSASAYKPVGWTTRTETWAASDFSAIPSGAAIEKVWLYVSYNWDTTPGGVPNITTTFNNNPISLGIPYTDQSNFGSFASYKYGLYPAIDVTSLYNASGNTLGMTPNAGNSNALYPSTLVVIYSDAGSTRKQIFMNEEVDNLATSQSSYGTTLEEATAYAPFTDMTIDTGSVQRATLHSFATNAGPNEGNLLFNGYVIGTGAWQGSSSTASAQTFNVTSRLTATGNEAAIQGDSSGGMCPIQQILVVEYTAAPPVAGFSGTPRSGTVPLKVVFTDSSSGTITSRVWAYKLHADTTWTPFTLDGENSFTFPAVGMYDVNLTVIGPGGSNTATEDNYITVTEAAPVAGFSGTPRSGTVPLKVVFTDSSSGTITSHAWAYKLHADTTWTPFTLDGENSFTFPAVGVYDVNLTVTGPGGSNTATEENYITVTGIPSIEVTLGNSSVTLSNMVAGQNATGSATVNVVASNGAGWSVSAADGKTPPTKGFMVSGSTPLTNPIQLGKDNAAYQALTADYTSFMSDASMGSFSAAASLKQPVVTGDGAGTYGITVTFTGAIS
jgi:PKD repeat protein